MQRKLPPNMEQKLLKNLKRKLRINSNHTTYFKAAVVYLEYTTAAHYSHQSPSRPHNKLIHR
jgi:hypothetical protein